MKLSLPIYRLKRVAKSRARTSRMPLHAALDEIARQEGFRNWSQLAAKHAQQRPTANLLRALRPGDMVLLGARPGQGKTLLGLELIVESIRRGDRGYFFTLEYTSADVLDRLRDIETDPAILSDKFVLDTSNDICADYVITHSADAPAKSLIVIDYLQLLDQKRSNLPLEHQLPTLKEWARHRNLIVVLISQIDRAFEGARDRHPGLEDVRLPNPADLSLFSKSCFLHDGEIRLQQLR